MKNAILLMLGLAAGTASFAQTTEPQLPAVSVSITTDQKLKLILSRRPATATITLRDNVGHLLYSGHVYLNNGLYQYFNLSELTTGTYQLGVAVDHETMVKTVTIAQQPAQTQVSLTS